MNGKLLSLVWDAESGTPNKIFISVSIMFFLTICVGVFGLSGLGPKYDPKIAQERYAPNPSINHQQISMSDGSGMVIGGTLVAIISILAYFAVRGQNEAQERSERRAIDGRATEYDNNLTPQQIADWYEHWNPYCYGAPEQAMVALIREAANVVNQRLYNREEGPSATVYWPVGIDTETDRSGAFVENKGSRVGFYVIRVGNQQQLATDSRPIGQRELENLQQNHVTKVAFRPMKHLNDSSGEHNLTPQNDQTTGGFLQLERKLWEQEQAKKQGGTK